jgi:hypothetical protein
MARASSKKGFRARLRDQRVPNANSAGGVAAALKVEVPFGQVDLRDDGPTRSRGGTGPLDAKPSVDRHGGRVFQYLGGFDQPGEISWRPTPAGSFTISGTMKCQSMVTGGPKQLIGRARKALPRPDLGVESMRLTRARAEQATAPQ